MYFLVVAGVYVGINIEIFLSVVSVWVESPG